MPSLLAAQPRQRGVSMVEALVALLVLSIGLLGIAGMFLDSVKSSRTALLRTHAINLVSDMADRIRANAAAGAAYNTAGRAPVTQDCAPTRNSGGSNCSIAQLAEDDLARWIASVNDLLPTTTVANAASVTRTEAAAGQPERYRIEVRWIEPGLTAPNSYVANVIAQPRLPIN
jgi:type IV pilus assembly protein PilV